MKDQLKDIEALAAAFKAMTETTAKMEESYRLLESRVAVLDRELANKNQELAEKIDQLALTSDYLSSLLESMSDGVIAVDLELRITRFNRAATLILGYQAEEVIGRPFKEVFKRDFSAPKHPGEMELLTRSGRQAPVSERNSPVADASGATLGQVKTFQDLSEISALREQVRQIDRLAAIGEMAATVAHEIRNPLGGIRGFASFLADDIPAEDPKRRLVDKILIGAQSLEKVVNELLEYTRPVELQLQPTRLAAIVESAIALMTHDPRRITIFTEVDPDFRVLADGEKVRQVLLNMLLNAVQSIEGKGEISITATADPQNEIVIAIEDTGCGMSPDQVKRIFSPFYTTKEKGTGLGLAVCQKIIEGHGGEVSAESEVGQGSCLRIRLPRTE